MLFLAEGLLVGIVPEEKQHIVITPDKLLQLEQEFTAQAGRKPGDKEKENLLQRHVDQEILFLEALRLKLYLYDAVIEERLAINGSFLETSALQGDVSNNALIVKMLENDLVIRRRLIERLEKEIAANIVVAPSDSVLRDYFAQHLDHYKLEKRVQIFHAFADFSKLTELEANTLFAKWSSGELNDSDLRNATFNSYIDDKTALSHHELARLFGKPTAQSILTLSNGDFMPLHISALGYHFIQVKSEATGDTPDFEIIRATVLQDYLTDLQSRAVSIALVEFRKNYEVTIIKQELATL